MKLRVIGAKLSTAQIQLIREAQDILDLHKMQSYRRAYQLLVESAGLKWIDDVPKHGGNRHKEKSILTNIDETLDKG